MLDLDHEWIWDFWTLQPPEGPAHIFFLKAPRALGDPELRHRNARVGHAVSRDLRNWELQPDPLPPEAGQHDSMATWTGSAVASGDGATWLFTSGLSGPEDGRVQRVGAAVSHDLLSWTPTPLVLEADPRWYAIPEDGEVHWRDPFVIRDAVGTWHMYLTAKTPGEPGEHGNGVVGHATSLDLIVWEVRPPLGRARGVFDQLEVISLTQIDRTWVLVFSCLGPEIVGAESGDGGVWSLVVDGPGAPMDLGSAARVTSEALYVGRVVETGDGPALLAFRHADADGAFIGGVTDPIPVRLRADGVGIEIDPAADVPDRWRPSGTASDVTG